MLVSMFWFEWLLPFLSPTLSSMPASKFGLEARTFVAVLLALARRYEYSLFEVVLCGTM